MKKAHNNKGQTDAINLLFTVGIVLSVIYFFIQIAGYTIFTPYTSEKFVPTENVQVLNEFPKTVSYKEIGEIRAGNRFTTQATIDNIVKEAKKVGADAVVIKQRTEKETIAIAIKFIK